MFNEQPHTKPPNPHHDPNSFVRWAAAIGLHPVVALAYFIVDQMLFASEVASGFLLVVLSFFVALALWLPVTILQHHLYGDRWAVAASKSCIASILLAIPTGFPAAVTCIWGLAGAVGWQHRPARRETIETNGFEVKRGPNGKSEE